MNKPQPIGKFVNEFAIVMEWHPYTLKRAAKEKLDCNLLSILADVVEGLRHLHNNNVWHRDVKPSNILISKGRIGVLCDFGIATNTLENDKTEKTNIGTEGYRAPELDSGKYDHRIDIFCFGMVVQFAIHCTNVNWERYITRELGELANNCVKSFPDTRPTLVAVLQNLGYQPKALTPKLPNQNIIHSVPMQQFNPSRKNQS